MSRFALLAPLWLAASICAAQLGGPPPPDPVEVLAAAKAASGGPAWDALRSQHSKVNIHTGGLVGQAERWSEFATGRSALAYTIGPVAGAAGFDGKVAWSQDAQGKSQVETDVARELAVNASYRDRLAFWYPERAPARIAYKERAEADGAFFDVIRITPEGGRPFELWINVETKLIERLVEREAHATRTEIYMDLRDIDGVKVPYRVRASRGAAKYDEVVVVDSMEFNAPLGNVRFAQPEPPKPDFAFPAGRGFVEVPFEVHSGHLFLRVTINGKAPVRMLFDSGGHNVLLPRVAALLDLKPEGGGVVGMTRAERVELAGVVLERQAFATIDLGDFLRRVEGLPDIGGIIGYELLRRFPIKLDYERSRAVIYNPAGFRYMGTGTRVPILFSGQHPRVRGQVDGIAGLFHVDTGSRGSLTLTEAFVADHGLTGKYGAKMETVYGASITGPMRATLARVKSLEFGEVVVKDAVAMLSLRDTGTLADPELAGNVGNAILRQFNITFDFPDGVLYFERNANFGKPEAYDRAGVWIERGENGFEVIDVMQGSPAAEAGLKPGDVVVAVNGRSWTSIPLSALRAELSAAAGRRVRLTVAGGGARSVTLRDLI